jgi:O-methyltransferase involved in polyketide biosynthesis
VKNLKPGLSRLCNPVRILCGLFVFWLAAELLAQQPADEEGRIRFCAVDIFVDSGSTPLAAYQFRFAVTNGTATIVGIEGGDHPAFRQPPFYDPKAIQSEVAIVASFNTAPADELPKGKTRVATIHLQTIGARPSLFDLKLQTAADNQGNKLACTESFEQRNSQ